MKEAEGWREERTQSDEQREEKTETEEEEGDNVSSTDEEETKKKLKTKANQCHRAPRGQIQQKHHRRFTP